MSVELKIKSKHLSEEARIIRFEERKLRGKETPPPIWFSIRQHRKWDVRNENRATFLARAYLAGKPYASVEKKVKSEGKRDFYIIPRLVAMINKYSGKPPISNHAIKIWFAGDKL
jgi:hypothetical protein